LKICPIHLGKHGYLDKKYIEITMNLTEKDPAEDREDVLRRILNHEDFIKLDLKIPITPLSFMPTKQDLDGISVFRKFFSSPQEIADSGSNEKGYHVAAITVAELRQKDFSVLPDPQENTLKGHALIPELKYSKDKNIKKKNKVLSVKLAKLASKNIVLFRKM